MRHSQWEMPTPAQISEESLARDWTLAAADRELVWESRTEVQRCDMAVQLCVVRKHGRFLDGKTHVPKPIVNHLCGQLKTHWPEDTGFQTRPSTRSAQSGKLLRHLGFHWFGEADAQELRQWLITQAPVSGWDDGLWVLVERRLLEKKVVLPGPSVLERLMAGVMGQAQDRLLRELAAGFPPPLVDGIGRMLVLEPGSFRSRFSRLKEPVARPTAAVLAAFLNQYEFLRDLQLEKIDLQALGPLVDRYAQRVKNEDVAVIKKWATDRRLVAMACFLVERLRFTLEALVDLHSQYIHRLEKNAQVAYETKKRTMQKQAELAAAIGIDYGDALLQVQEPEQFTVSQFWQKHPRGELENAVLQFRTYQTFKRDGFWEEIRSRHGFLHRYAQRFFSLPFEAERGHEALLHAVEWARGLPRLDGWELPAQVPMGFVPPSWRAGVRQADGKLDRRIWEFALARALRENIRTGSIFLGQTRRYAAYRDLVFSDAEWTASRQREYEELNLPQQADDALRQLQQELDEAATRLEKGLSKNPFVAVKDGRWTLKKDDNLPPCPEADRLRRHFLKTIPSASLEQVVARVDSWCRYSQAFRPMREFRFPTDHLTAYLYAVLVGHGANFGIVDMARKSKGLDSEILFEINHNFFREECIRAADRLVINFHHSLPLSQAIGDGRFSSSDGQRFRIHGKSAMGSPYPRRGGYYAQMAGIYTHLSNQRSAYWTQVSSVREREDAVMLAGLVEQNTDLDPTEHTTDTHGYTDIGFGICRLMGYSFMPRLRDLSGQNIFKLDSQRRYGVINTVFSPERFNVSLVVQQWDDMIRTIASLRQRRVSAVHLLRRLHRSNHPLARAFQQYGRIAKTLHILRYLQEPVYRKRIRLQLNWGESHHFLVSNLSIGRLGAFTSADHDEMTKRATCLNLLCNILVTWNTVHLQNLINQLRGQGEIIAPETLLRISPVFWNHINLTGTYDFLGAATEVQKLTSPWP